MEQLAVISDWREPLILAGQVLLILLLAWAVQRLVGRGITRLGERYAALPTELWLPLRGLLRWLIMGSALMLVLERLGVSAEVLWTALTGFVAVAAVAFFAIWSVLSNMFCALLIFSMGPFRIGDIVQMKKKHPCGSQEWEVLQLGSDMRIKCCGCGHIVLIPRPKFLKGAKKVLNRDITQDTPLAVRTSEFEGE